MVVAKYSVIGQKITDHCYEVPLNYNKPKGHKISVFVRELVDFAKKDADLPYVIFFQGGPGFSSSQSLEKDWVKRLLEEYRVLLLDSRGTGQSTLICAQTLAGMTPEEQADYLQYFRADNIVRDAEFIRKYFIRKKKLRGKNKKWTLCGQSFGGFCIMVYLSMAPKAIKAYYITGGIPAVDRTVDEIYTKTYKQVIIENKRYYERYPQDRNKLREIATYLRTNDVRLPSGDPLSVRKFQLLGINFGISTGFTTIHNLVETAFVEGQNGKELSYLFLKNVEGMIGFDTNPIFAILHEPIYGDAHSTDWAAERLHINYPELSHDEENGDFYFTGEMVYPWMFDDISQLQVMKEAANILASKKDWPALYNRNNMKSKSIPGAAAIYYSDMYVPVDFSVETAAKYLPGVKLWITNEYKHNGTNIDGYHILDRLISLVKNKTNCHHCY